MRTILSIALLALCSANARAELFELKDSRSPDGRVVLAINYPPTEPKEGGEAQVCFLDQKTKKQIGGFFYLPGSDGETDHPGTYPFDNYAVFSFRWSADSTHIAIQQNWRYGHLINAYRRTGNSFEWLKVPEMYDAIEKRVERAVARGPHNLGSILRWNSKHELVATIYRYARMKDTGDEDRDWKNWALDYAVSFSAKGEPKVKELKFYATEW